MMRRLAANEARSHGNDWYWSITELSSALTNTVLIDCLGNQTSL